MHYNESMNIVFHPIGVIHTPFNLSGSTPRQPAYAKGTKGQIEIFPQFIDG